MHLPLTSALLTSVVLPSPLQAQVRYLLRVTVAHGMGQSVVKDHPFWVRNWQAAPQVGPPIKVRARPAGCPCSAHTRLAPCIRRHSRAPVVRWFCYGRRPLDSGRTAPCSLPRSYYGAPPLCSPLVLPPSLGTCQMEVGIEDCLLIEFEYDRGAYHLGDTVLGRIHFLLVSF